MKHYSINELSVKSKIAQNSMAMFIGILERNLKIVNNGNYKRQCQWFDIFNPKIAKFNDNYSEIKFLQFNGNGLDNYIDQHNFYADNKEFIIQKEVEFVTYGKVLVPKFWKEFGHKKTNYINFNIENLGQMLTNESIYLSMLGED